MMTALRRALCGLLLPALGALPAGATVLDAMLQQMQRSDFVFGRTDSYVPFPPLAYLTAVHHADSELDLAGGPLRFSENSLSELLVAPVWIGKRDMALAGEFGQWQHVSFSDPASAQRDLYTFMPVLAWLKQTGSSNQLGAFVAPEYVSGSDVAGYKFTEYSGYGGIIDIYWRSPQFAWVYGGIAYFSGPQNLLFPYLGLLWMPDPHWSLALIVPWPSISYAPSASFLLQLGIVPSDGTLASTNNGRGLQLSYTSWDLRFITSWRLNHSLWLSAGVGWSGLGNLAFSDGGANSDYKLNRGVVWSLQLSLRPATALSRNPTATSR